MAIEKKEQSKISEFLDSDLFKGLLPFIGLVVILGVMYWLTEGRIAQPKRMRLLLSQVYYPMIVATGVFFIMTLGSIDFTEGSTLGVASIVVSVLSFYNIPLAILGGILTGAAIGAINGFFHVKFKLQSFIVTICTMYLFRGVCAYLTTETAIPASAAIKALDSDNLKISITVAVLVIAFFLFKFTRIGNDVKAVGSGETAARFSGVRTDKVKFLTFVAAGALTGLAAFVNVIKVGSITATAGNQLETQILISLVLGGLPITGGAKVRFSNIIVGTLMYTVLNNGLVMLGFESATQQLIKGIVFLIFVALTIDRKALKVIK
ncbi:MAG: ABC transporter permease [Synergistaceae bacterium]|nr:ABC transporter permease [Synergistaceae bacterium]MBQ6738369.1 ABC transporter permease [Synergistaceae bacterium]MBR0074917.1 ABC transporter permease [Synergistaceae bacterium]MBR0252409.1 ABC transporter permease [Synergistaceae bacterium]MBR0317319.1 ABC transporter permease [Synergistaceae bacterium]